MTTREKGLLGIYATASNESKLKHRENVRKWHDSDLRVSGASGIRPLWSES